MLHRTLRSLLEMYPRGATAPQLVAQLRRAGVRVPPDELAAGLAELVNQGEAQIDPARRWALVRALPQTERAQAGAAGSVPDAIKCQLALRHAEPAAAPEPVETAQDDASPTPDWRPLMQYYAATQRLDPRGRISRFPDTHARNWLTFETAGVWWSQARLDFDLDRLPPDFQLALMKIKVKSAALGWPLLAVESADGPKVLPALIIAANWRLGETALEVRPSTGQPTLNPDWIREVRRRTEWTEGELIEALFPEGEENDFDSVARRLKLACATLIEAPLKPADLAPRIYLGGATLQNAAALFLPDERSFTIGAARDLDQIAEWDKDVRSGTALAALIEGDGRKREGDAALLSATALTDRQTDACDSALTAPLTVVQGPPGTGKSQIITALVLSAVLDGRSVLFASKNHQALDEVQGRLRQIMGDTPLLVRGLDRSGETNVSFIDALKEIAKSDDGDLAPGQRDFRETQTAAARAAGQIRFSRREIDALHLRLCALDDRPTSAVSPDVEAHAGWWSRLLRWIDRLLGRSSDASEPDERSHDAEAEMTEIRAKLDAQGEAEDGFPPELPTGWQDEVHTLSRAMALPERHERQSLADRVAELTHSGKKAARHLSADDARRVIQRRPVWIMSTLSAPKRIPLEPGLFDLVIIDEASQCDIASSLPLFARGRSGVVVGDPQQLEFIRSVSRETDHALMDHVGLPKPGRARFSQISGSLFDFADRSVSAARHFLADQFRSHPQIVEYLNDSFYSRRGLEARLAGESLKAPENYKPGLDWRNVSGRCQTMHGGTANPAEAQAVIDILKSILEDKDFDGSVGVIAPFNAQVTCILEQVSAQLNLDEREKLKLRVSTVDRFQGGEADIILFSLTANQTARRTALTFLDREHRRFNVAVSRARNLCMVIGDLGFARASRHSHIRRLAERATNPWNPPRPDFDSIPERRLYQAMLGRGWKPEPQFPVGTRRLDFGLQQNGRRLDIEVDGRRWHTDDTGARKTSDRMRDRELIGRGWIVVRFWTHELSEDMEGCLDRIERKLVE